MAESVMRLSLNWIFFFNDTATTEIYTLSLHDALPISSRPPGERPGRRLVHRRAAARRASGRRSRPRCLGRRGPPSAPDRKSTRLNSSHANISYAVFCLKKKKKTIFFQNHHLVFLVLC